MARRPFFQAAKNILSSETVCPSTEAGENVAWLGLDTSAWLGQRVWGWEG